MPSASVQSAALRTHHAAAQVPVTQASRRKRACTPWLSTRPARTLHTATFHKGDAMQPMRSSQKSCQCGRCERHGRRQQRRSRGYGTAAQNPLADQCHAAPSAVRRADAPEQPNVFVESDDDVNTSQSKDTDIFRRGFTWSRPRCAMWHERKGCCQHPMGWGRCSEARARTASAQRLRRCAEFSSITRSKICWF